MADEKDNGVNIEVEERLEELFGDPIGDEGDITERAQDTPLFPDQEVDPISPPENLFLPDSPLRELKSSVLSLEWEISDEVMSKFVGQVDVLKGLYREDKIPFLLLQLLESIGKYIKRRKGKAHPEAVKILISQYEGLEKLILAEGLTEPERKKILSSEVKKFRDLKEKIAVGKIRMGKKRPGIRTLPDPQKPHQPAGEVPFHHTHSPAVDEIKRFIKAEFQALRVELQLWREAQEEKNTSNRLER